MIITIDTEKEIQSQIVHALQVALVFGVGMLFGLAPGEAMYAGIAAWLIREAHHVHLLQRKLGVVDGIRHEMLDIIVGVGTAVALFIVSGLTAIF